MKEALSGLRCVVAWSDRRNLCTLIADRLGTIAGEREVRRLGDDAVIVYTKLSPEELREFLRHALDEDEGLMVIEFERWSGYGRALYAEWLLARGH
jgi:hypothetical protein